mmetsp:Transcript_82615/g.130161  ORF Transcript_82615/g.130161 Transcript_82615/m.130161 type:complete len:944 (+) Transcript_82615:147-2978(+)
MAETATKEAAPQGDLKIKLPIQITIPSTEEKSSMLKSYTAYIVNVVDFGRSYTIERRFDDFSKLHAEVSEIDKNLPPMPEKKMWSSTDSSIVAERRPAFEKLLKYMLRTEEIAFEKGQIVWKFLELPTPAMVAARYLFKSQRLSYAKQCGKLLDDKYREEHAYRLFHESILKTNLYLLSSEGLLVGGATTSEPSSEGAAPSKVDSVELEKDILEMLRHAVGQGGDEVRKVFLEEQGLHTMMKLLLRIAQRKGSSGAPSQHVRNVMNALIHGEGDRYPEVFASFLAKGGVSILAGFQDLCRQHGAFADFVGKALWLAWDVKAQQAFLEGDETGTEALGILGAVFGCGTKVSQIMAGLLLSSLIANNLFADHLDRESKAAAGISAIIEELLVAMPTFVSKKEGDKLADKSEDLQAAESLLLSQGKNEKAFARILTCVNAPLSRAEGSVPHETSAVWSACAFALWCLLKTNPKPARLVQIRPSIPLLAQYGPPRVRWLSGELLLHLHVEENASSGGQKIEVHADAISVEQNAVEAAMSEQLNHAVQSIQDGLQENRSVLSEQEQLANARQQALVIGPDGACFVEINKALASLIAVRERLVKASSATQSAEAQSSSSLDGLSAALQVDAQASQGDLDRALESVQGIEEHYLSKRDELTQLEEQLREQGGVVDACKNEMEDEDRAVTATRKRLTEMETELSSKQREAQQQRTLASSDLSSQRSRLTANVEEIDQKLLKLREKAQKMQNGEPLEAGQAPVDPAKVQEVMAQLKQQAAQLKQKKAELQGELSRSNVDPAAAQENALKLEGEADGLRDQINFVRVNELQELERSHALKRESWQRETSRVQEIRSIRDSLDREVSELKRQLDERWKTWRPLWSARLNHWHEKASALSEAQLRNHQFVEKVNANWQTLREEETVRAELLQAVAHAQDQLSVLAQQLSELGVMQ